MEIQFYVFQVFTVYICQTLYSATLSSTASVSTEDDGNLTSGICIDPDAGPQSILAVLAFNARSR